MSNPEQRENNEDNETNSQEYGFVPASPEVRPILEQFKKDHQYFDDHRATLREQFGQSWVAIYDQAVIATDQDPRDLFDKLREIKKEGIPAERSVVKRID